MYELDGRVGLTEQSIKEIGRLIRVGHPPLLSAEYAGLTRKQYKTYMAEGEIDIANQAKNTSCAKLWIEVTQARKDFFSTCNMALAKAGEKDWKAIAFLMEKADSEDYSEKSNAMPELEEVKITNDIECQKPEPLPEPTNTEDKK